MNVSTPGTTRVRRLVWALLVAAVLFALLVPAQYAWQAASSALQLRICIWPASPKVREMARLFVVPRTDEDRHAVAGPWTTFVVTRGMDGMAMDARPVLLKGQVTDHTALALPLGLEMAGEWWIQLVIQPRGRPMWQMRMPLTVLPPVGASLQSGTQGVHGPQGPLGGHGAEDPPSAHGCHIEHGSQQL